MGWAGQEGGRKALLCSRLENVGKHHATLLLWAPPVSLQSCLAATPGGKRVYHIH